MPIIIFIRGKIERVKLTLIRGGGQTKGNGDTTTGKKWNWAARLCAGGKK
jgi:hypothetical protein